MAVNYRSKKFYSTGPGDLSELGLSSPYELVFNYPNQSMLHSAQTQHEKKFHKNIIFHFVRCNLMFLSILLLL
jgi:hypothetical protein